MRDNVKNSTKIEALQKFASNNSDLAKLEALISEFNLFKILGIADFEIRHSSVLAWILSPAGHHGLGDGIFKDVLKGVFADRTDRTATDFINADYSDLNVLREWCNIDILAISPSNRLVVVIENKWNAAESEFQLAKYAEIIDIKFAGYEKVLVFLTLDGAKPRGCDRYIPFTHGQIYHIIKSNIQSVKDSMQMNVYDFIQQYLKILEETTMQNADIVDICSKIYQEHKEAIQMITNFGRPKLAPEHMSEFHERTGTESVFESKDKVNTSYYFIPSTWAHIMPQVDNLDKYPVIFRLNLRKYEDHKIGMELYSSVYPNAGERERFEKMLLEAAKKGENAKLRIKISKNYITVFTKTILLMSEKSGFEYDLYDYDNVINKLVDVYNKDAEVQHAFKVTDSIVREIWGTP